MAAPAPPAFPLQPLADRCVQCGLCLPACPTYGLERIEAESPRGRIALVRALERGTIDPSPQGEAHLDQCLGCRACEAVCPAGVEYGALLVAARTAQRERRQPGGRLRAIAWLAARPAWLAALLGMYRRLFPMLPGRLRPLPRPPRGGPPVPAAATAGVALFTGCAARAYEVPARAALAKLCAAVGTPLSMPPGQTCCGALHAHAGDVATATRLAEANRRAFAGADAVLTLATGCHDEVRRALAPGIAVDAAAYLARHAHTLAFRPTRERVALHLPCTQRNVVRSDGALRALLARVPGLDLVQLDAGFGCCGAAGSQMLEDPVRAARFREPLLQQFAASGATRLLSANIGCRLHFANGTRLPVQHPLEFLAECLA